MTEEVSAVELKRSEVKIQISHIEEKAFEDFNVSLQEMLNQVRWRSRRGSRLRRIG